MPSRKPCRPDVVVPGELAKIVATPKRPETQNKKENREAIFRLKEAVWDFEATNNQFIVFAHRDGNWWQCGDNSMLIYYYLIAKEFGIKDLRIRSDLDYNKRRWRYGFINTSNVDRIVEKMGLAGYTVVADAPEVKVFALPKPVLDTDFQAWRNSEKEKTARFNSLVVPKNVYPDFMNKAAILHREILVKAMNMSTTNRTYYGDKGVELSGWISYYGLRMVNGHLDAKEFFRESLDKLDEMIDWLAYVKKFNIFNIDTALRIVQEINEVQALAKTHLKALEEAYEG